MNAGGVRMRHVDAVLTEWYAGEVGGKALFRALAQAGGPDAAAKWLALAAVEDAVASTLSAALTARRIPLPSLVNVDTRARQRCESVAGQSWPQTMQWLRRIAADALVHMQSDAALLPAELEGLGRMVVRHEMALVSFAELELAGDPQSLEPIEAFLGSFV
jgi:hypothetical protein